MTGSVEKGALSLQTKHAHALASIRGEIGRAIEDLASGARTEPFSCLWIGAGHNVRITVTKEEKR